MNPDIYETIKDIAIELVNSSELEDTKKYWNHYHQLEEICSDNDNSDSNHPFQWETLGDFTTDNNSALKIYEKALEVAETKNLKEYSASVYFAMAERHKELGNKDLAINIANQANTIAKQLDDLSLRKEISEFLLNECQ